MAEAPQGPSRRSKRGRRKRGRLQLIHLPEPEIVVGHGQAVEDPRDGLTLFGPLDEDRTFGIRVGVIGTEDGMALYRAWAQRIQGYLTDRGSQIAHPPFPGFETVFRVPWPVEPVLTVRVPRREIDAAVLLDDQHERVYKAVGVYVRRINEALRGEDAGVDVWFVVIPDAVHTYCRPESRVPADLQVKSSTRVGRKFGKRLAMEPSMFADENRAAIPYQYEVDFHNQLKARLLGKAPTQIVRESTLEVVPDDVRPRPKHDALPFQAAIAWNLCSAAFYKAGARPWRTADVRVGVCYVGIVFKRDDRNPDPTIACCAAQMFLHSGDGMVFRGAVGPWYSDRTRQFHLSRAAARQLASMVVAAYRERHDQRPPHELFIHGRAFFNDEEWQGFADAVDSEKTNLVGVRIRDEPSFRFFRPGKRAVLRGTALVLHDKGAYLMTRGHVPRLRTQVGLEVPRPLRIDIAKGKADILTVLGDVLALTKLNYNACIFADGLPVTLRFADSIGEILTAGPVTENEPLPFKHYI